VLAVTGPHALEAVMRAIHAHLPPAHDPLMSLVPPQGIRLTPGDSADGDSADGDSDSGSDPDSDGAMHGARGSGEAGSEEMPEVGLERSTRESGATGIGFSGFRGDLGGSGRSGTTTEGTGRIIWAETQEPGTWSG
jgi:hypothetical protein